MERYQDLAFKIKISGKENEVSAEKKNCHAAIFCVGSNYIHCIMLTD